jgi:hypothetical protein
MLSNNDFYLKEIWHPKSGTAVIAKLGKGLIKNGLGIPTTKRKTSPMEVC